MKNIYPFLKLKSCVFIALLLLLFGSSNAQTIAQIEKAEDEASSIRDQSYTYLQQHAGLSDADLKEFVRYYQDTLGAYVNKLTNNLQNTLGTNSFKEQVYLSAMQDRCLQMYTNFKQIKAEFPSSVAEALAPKRWHNPTGTCNPACDNIDFSNGDLSAWTCGYGDCSAENGNNCNTITAFSVGTPVFQTPGAGVRKSGGPDAATGSDYQVTLESGGTDAVTGVIPKVCPGYAFSAMVGDSNGGPGKPSSGVAFLEQTFQVTPANADFFYNYAVVLNNPTHCYYQQPYFSVVMLDQNGDTIPHCGNYSVVAGGTNISSSSTWQYINKGSNNEIDYLNWTTAFVSLKNYIGQCITVQVITADCGKGGHFGYAYFVAKCKQLGIITSAPALCGNPITLTAPTGGVSYQWTAPGAGCMTPAAGNTQSISISCPGKYSVIIQTVAGAACADTLDTVIVGAVGTPPVPFFKSDTACAGNPTLFTNLTTGGSAANTYTWTFQGGATSTVSNPSYTFPSAGTYTVMLQSLNGGCGADTTLNVIVTGPPTASFTAPAVCQNSPTGFTNTSTGGAVVFKWSFGDGSTSNAASPTHTYAACGTYSVVLVAGTAPCVDSAKQVVTVNPNPKPAFTANPVCLGNNTVLTDTTKVGCGGTEASWSWMFGDPASGASNTSAVQNPTHVFSDTGCYAVFFKITTNNGCMDSMTRPVCIVGPPVPKFVSGPVCLGSPTVFTNQSTPTPFTSKWSFGDPANGTSTATNPSYTYTAAGTYTVKLIVTSGAGCIDSITSTVTVNPPPTAGFTVATVCQGTPSAFKDTSHGGATYKWTFGDGTGTSTLQNPTYTYATSGTFQVKEVVTTAAGCKDSITLPAIVNPNPTATITVPPVCLGTASVFTLTPTNMGATGTYAWTLGDGVGTSTAQNPTYTYTANNAYTASVTLTSASGCVGTATVIAVVNPIPVPQFTAPPVCLGKSTQFTSTSALANIPPTQTIKTYVWAFGDGSTATGASSVTHPYIACGAYSATLVTISAAGCAHDTAIEDTVHPVPIPSFTATSVCKGLANSFTDKSTIGCGGSVVSWLWNFGDGTATSTLQNPTHTYAAAGIYNVSLTVESNKTPFCDSTVILPVTVYPIPVPSFTSTNPCFGTATTFTNTSTVAGGTIATSAWRFGDPAAGTSAATSPTYTYAAPGTYNVTLTVVSNYGCVDSVTLPTIVHPIPVPLFASDTVGCTPLCIAAFRDSSKVTPPDNITKWLWNFGDGSVDSSSTAEFPAHCYTKVGTYSLGLTVTTEAGCSASNTLVNYITTWPVPVAKFSASPNPTDTLTPTVVFTDASAGNPVWWHWTFGDRTDSTDTTQNTTHTYLYTGTFQDTGKYTATLWIKNKYGCIDSVYETIQITPFWTFYIPNAFTPNNDGVNDGFIPKAVGLREFQMWIFNRWGQELYHCTSLTQPWDGTVHTGPSSGTQCQEDTYVWLVEFTDIYHNNHRYVGRVTLIR